MALSLLKLLCENKLYLVAAILLCFASAGFSFYQSVNYHALSEKDFDTVTGTLKTNGSENDRSVDIYLNENPYHFNVDASTYNRVRGEFRTLKAGEPVTLKVEHKKFENADPNKPIPIVAFSTPTTTFLSLDSYLDLKDENHRYSQAIGAIVAVFGASLCLLLKPSINNSFKEGLSKFSH
jgi:hypothetical protein